MTSKVAQLEASLKGFLRGKIRGYRRAKYLRSGKRAWSEGYGDYKASFLANVLADSNLLGIFRDGLDLPANYGDGLDERVVEIPWALSRLSGKTGHLLDAGSALNHEYLVDAPSLAGFKLSIITLAPEAIAFWRRGVS